MKCLARTRGISVLIGELCSLAILLDRLALILIRALDLTAPPLVTEDLEDLEALEEEGELPRLSRGSRPCDLRRLLLMALILGWRGSYL